MSGSIDELKALLEEQQQRIEALEQEQEKLQKQYQAAKQQNEQVLNLFEQFKSGAISRRAFLTSVSAVAGISWLAGSADAAPNWSNASGNSGTQSKPLKNVYAQNGTFQSVSSDETNTDLIKSKNGNQIIKFESANINDGTKQALSYSAALIFVQTQFDDFGMFTIKGGSNSVAEAIDPSGAFTTTADNQGTTNIYHDGSDYVIENETGTDPFGYNITYFAD
ncbi:hypothetical protein [Haloarcula sp. H-GB5]